MSNAEKMASQLEMAHVVRASLQVPGLPVLTSNQCYLLAQELNKSLAPAQQGQGEPVGYVCGSSLDAALNGRIGAESIAIRKEPTGYINKPLYTHPAPGPGELVVFRCIDPDGDEGNWYDADPGSLQAARNDVERGMFSRIELAYTHANLTDVAQLELEIEQLRFSLTMNDCASVEDDCVRDENRELRTQLTELWRAAKLLMQVTPRNKSSWADKREAAAIIERLSASAEPSVPVEIDERAEFNAWAVRTGRTLGYLGWREDFDVWQARAALERK